MNEHDFSKKTLAKLDRAPLSGQAERRLHQARQSALAAARFQSESPLILAGQRLSYFWHRHHAASTGLILLIILLLLGSGWQWQQHRTAEMQVDTLLLADELPVEAFLADRFEQGIKP